MLVEIKKTQSSPRNCAGHYETHRSFGLLHPSFKLVITSRDQHIPRAFREVIVYPSRLAISLATKPLLTSGHSPNAVSPISHPNIHLFSHGLDINNPATDGLCCRGVRLGRDCCNGALRRIN